MDTSGWSTPRKGDRNFFKQLGSCEKGDRQRLGESTTIPVIASDFPLWRKIIDGAQCGLLVDPVQPKAIANAIDWLLDHPNEAEQMGKNGRKAVVEQYNWQSENKKLIELYRKLAA